MLAYDLTVDIHSFPFHIYIYIYMRIYDSGTDEKTQVSFTTNITIFPIRTTTIYMSELQLFGTIRILTVFS